MTYDPIHQWIILFGGYNGSNYLSDTWVFDCNTNSWALLFNSSPVSRRRGQATSFDPIHQWIILFGGYNGSNYLSDTWVFDCNSISWVELYPNHSPRNLAFSSMAYDSLNDRMILFGGKDSQKFFNETWFFTTHPPSIKVNFPDGGETLYVGRIYSFNWSFSHWSNLKIELNRNYPSGNWETLFPSTQNDGTENWVVTTPTSSNCRIRVSSVYDPDIYDISDENFYIGMEPPHNVTITSGPSASPSPISSGGTTSLSVSASDSLGHALTYSWSVLSSPIGNGTFSNPNSQNPTWTAPQNYTGVNQTVTLKVRASCSVDSSKYAEGTVNVTVQPAPLQPLISFTPASFAFTATHGGANPDPQTLKIRNGGGGALNWTVSDDASWLALFPSSGSSTGEEDNVTLSVNIMGLAPNTYHATISISAPGASNSPQYIPVTLIVSPSPNSLTLHLSSGWNLISIPFSTDPDPKVVFSGLPTWRMFSWNPITRSYLDKNHTTLELGKGFWLWVPNAVDYQISGTPNTSPSTEIPLYSGWNMIGTPYNQAIPWDSVQVRRGSETVSLNQAVLNNWLRGYAYYWESNSYKMLRSGGSFTPLYGYWLYAKVDGCTLIFQKP